MPQSVEKIVQSAQRAAGNGQWQEAERQWKNVLKRAPAHPQALTSLGMHALQRGDTELALKRLEKARKAAPGDLFVLMTLVDVHRQHGDAGRERDAIDAALAADAYFVPALLARGNWLERHATPAQAATVYANALKISPQESDWPPAWREPLAHARDFTDRQARAMENHLQTELGEALSALPPDQAGRWREATAIRAGRGRPFLSQSNQLHVPRLPAVPFFERELFPFLGPLEAATNVIRDELGVALDQSRDRFQPYIAYRPGEPVNQWHELDHSDRWSAFHLWRGGQPVMENLERCPQTRAVLEDIRLCDLDGLCPNVFFSALAPGTHIPPHNGESNARVIAHLPLVVPDNCWLRVGFERRHWRVGETLIFDDTIEHEAANESGQLRVVMIFDLWNPLLNNAERDLASALAVATRQFRGT